MTAENIIIPRLEMAAMEGRLDGLHIEYWVGGGQPPPYYRSEQFHLLSRGEMDQMEFAILRFHPELIPHEVSERYTLSGISEDLRTITRLLIDLRVYEIEFPEEKDPGIAGGFSHEITVDFKKSDFEKLEMKRTYYRTMPVDLASLDKVLQRMIAKTMENGLHSWHHLGRSIENPFDKVEN